MTQNPVDTAELRGIAVDLRGLGQHRGHMLVLQAAAGLDSLRADLDAALHLCKLAEDEQIPLRERVAALEAERERINDDREARSHTIPRYETLRELGVDDIDAFNELAIKYEKTVERVAAAEGERDNLRSLLHDICSEWNEDCDPACDKWGHVGECKATNLRAAKAELRQRAEAAEAEVARQEARLRAISFLIGDHVEPGTPESRVLSLLRLLDNVVAGNTSERESSEAALAEERRKREHIQQEAEIHAQEARTQRATVHEIYQLVRDASGEPGDWNGAEPVRRYIEEQTRKREAVERDAERLDFVLSQERQYAPMFGVDVTFCTREAIDLAIARSKGGGDG